jgi:hypothetical protein
MRKKLLCFLLCLFLLPLGVIKDAGGDGITRCLLIGCDRFVSMPDTEPAGANNVETMEALLTDFLPGETRIQRYVNGPGTVEGFERLMETVFRDANDADRAVIYLSTHGLLREEERMVLLLSDGESEEYLEPEKLKQILDKVPGEKTLILDACHSGAMIGCGGGNGVNWFADGSCQVLTSSGALEDSWFWSAEEDTYTGTGYFTSAMDNALRSSDPDQIDPNGDGKISLEELTARLRKIHGASTVYCWPENRADSLFRLPENRKPRNRLRGLCFAPLLLIKEGGTRKLEWHFRTEDSVRLMYHLIPSHNGKWDFEHDATQRDPGHVGLNWGMVGVGEYDRHISRTLEQFGKDGQMLFQVISMKPDFSSPMVEGGIVMRLEDPVLPMEEETEPEAE